MQLDRKKCKKACKKACKDECNAQPECTFPPLVPENCDDSSQTTPDQCAPIAIAGKAKFCTETLVRQCSRSCGLCLDGIPRFESCDGDRSPDAGCQRGVQASVEYTAQAAKDKYCTAQIQKECPVTCMGASTNEGQCPVARESCADLSTTHPVCQRGVVAYAEDPELRKPDGSRYNADESKNEYCTAQIQPQCPVTCMGASDAGDQCESPDGPE